MKNLIKYSIQGLAMMSDIVILMLSIKMYTIGAYVLLILVLLVWLKIGIFYSWKPSAIRKFFTEFDKIWDIKGLEQENDKDNEKIIS